MTDQDPAFAMQRRLAPPASLRGHRSDIEGIRALAVSLVVFFHAGLPGLSGGFIGVDVFFAISGYLITPHLIAELEDRRRIDIINFYARRFRRLLPGAATMMLTVLAVGMLIASPFEQRQYLGAAVATAFYASNIWFILKSGDYFGAAAEDNPFVHTWSLAVEEQFYILVPLAMLAAFAWRGRRGVVELIVGLSIVTFILCVALTPHAPTTAFYLSVTRFWEFGAGALAGLIDWRIEGRQRLAGIAGWLGMALVLLTATVFLTPRSIFPGALAVLPVAGTVAMLMAGRVHPQAGFARLLSFAPFQWLGARSYSWYLWHWPILVFAAKLVPDMGLAGRMAALLLSLVLAIASYTLVENPIRFHPLLSGSKRRSVVMGVGLTLLLAGSAVVAQRIAVHMGQSPLEQAAALASAEAPPANCTQLPGAAPTPETCVFGDQTAARTVVLLGDSHAEQWLHPLSDSLSRRHVRLVLIARLSCPLADVPAVFVSTLRRTVPECVQWRDRAIDRIAQLHPSAVIVATSQHYVDVPERVSKGVGASAVGQIRLADWQSALERTLTRLKAISPSVIYLRDTPRPTVDVPTCLARTHLPIRALRPQCGMMTREVLPASLWTAEQGAIHAAGATPLDLTGPFCTGASCPTVLDGTVVYRDGSHISERMAGMIAKDVDRALAARLPATP